MSDYPQGEWSPVLVGHVWPTSSNLEILANQSTIFGSTASDYYHLEEQLRIARFGPLSNQEGATAEELREAFRNGEKNAQEIAQRSENKKASYSSAHLSATSLRSALTEIAQEGNSKIKEIQTSKEPIPAKIEKITSVVLDCQQMASSKAAILSDTIFDAIQKILDRENISTSARKFAVDRGLSTEKMFQNSSKQTVKNMVQEKLDSEKSSNIYGKQGDKLPQSATYSNNSTQIFGTNGQEPSQVFSTEPSTSSNNVIAPPISEPVRIYGNKGEALPLTKAAPTASAPQLPQVPIAGASSPPISAPSVPTLPSLPGMSAAVSAPALTPGELLQSFDHGMQTGTSMSAATNALASGPMAAIESHLAPPTPDTPAATAPLNIPATAHATAYDPSAHGPAPVTEAPQPQNHTSSTDGSATNTTYLAAPAGAGLPTSTGTSLANPLPAYGTDIRPPAPTAPALAAATSAPPSAPVSAPVNPSSAGNAVSQPAVVRQPVQPVHPTASAHGAQTPPGVVAQAVASTATGAASAAISATAAARKRLQQLVAVVARQEPRLRWAAGDRPDGTTMLVTDLACGWIPPHIDIPVGMELPQPASRHGDIHALLGEVTVMADCPPQHHVPSAGPINPVATSPRARQVDAPEELGWQLSQATQRRDGLPRLASTLANAAARGTGVLDSEVELLRLEVGKLREQVIQSYPTQVEPAALTDWQLLAAIDALANGDKIGANYHFAWFQALSPAPAGRRGS